MSDLQGKPSYLQGECPVCKEWKTVKRELKGPHCIRCKNKLKFAYESQSIHHWHIRTVGGTVGYTCVMESLCVDCYKQDWKKVYPEEPVPV